MTREVIATDNAPKAIGPYSQGIKANGFVFCSGQIPLDPSIRVKEDKGLSEAFSYFTPIVENILKEIDE